MKKRYLNMLCLALAVLLMNCSGGTTEEGNTTTDKPTNGGSEPTKEEVKIETPTEPNSLCLWPSLLSIRQEVDPKSKSITTISINEKLIFAGEEQKHEKHTYVKVKLVDGKEGWLRKDFVGLNATGAAISQESSVYKRPDLMSKSDKKFAPMTVVAITETKGDWVQVRGKNGKWFTDGWIKKSNITTEEVDVVVAAFYMKAKTKKSEEGQLKALQEIVSTSDFAGSDFISTISDEINKEPEPEEMSIDEMPVEEEEDTTGGGE